MKKRIMNVVNFVRGCEPRKEMDLFTPVKNEIEIDRQYNIPHTFLLQYDAMLREDFCALFSEEQKHEGTELGVWMENCRTLIEGLGIEWRGRPGYDWDWYVNPGFLMAYTPKQREAIIDEVFRKFKEIFGDYPTVVGSWLLDAYSMEYMSKTYRIKAFCICREQFAVDAYTLWGGYYSGGYYPSRNNMLSPAQTKEAQIDTPVFRMLGIDPIYGYDEKYKPLPFRGCATLEPGWSFGQAPEIVDWYLDTYYRTPCLSHAQMTTGQENSFGWKMIGPGYPLQMERLAALRDAGDIVIEPLGTTGEAYKNAFSETPAAALISDKLAPMVDFFSVGTNDLIQYTLACDRQNPALEQFCDTHHEAVLSLIELSAKNAHANGAWIGICGELASDFSLTERFLRMGIDELSVSPSYVLRLRDTVRSIRIE
jgi:hypothetical protein